MKLLLAAVNAKYIHSNLAVYSLRACATEYEKQIGIAEYTINHRAEAILADLYKRGPQVIAFFLLYMELEDRAGAVKGTSKGNAGYCDLAGRT